MATAFLLVAPLALLSGRPRRASVLWVNVVITAIFMGDVTHALFFRDLMSMHGAGGLSGLPAIADSIQAMVGPGQAFLVGDIVLIVLWRLIRRKSLTVRLGSRWHAIGLLAICLIFASWSLRIHAKAQSTGVFLRVWSTRALVRGAGVVGFHLHDTVRYLADQVFVWPLEPADRVAVEAHWATKDRILSEENSSLNGAAVGANIIFLMVESLQEQALNQVVEGGRVTPNLDALVSESIRFTRFHHQTAQGRTADGESLSLCGLYPLSQGAVFFRYPDYPQQCLPEVLRDEAGYTTASFHGMTTRFWNRAAVEPRLGIQKSFGKPDYARGRRIGLGLADAPFLNQTADKISRLSEPFFAHVITLSSHHPFPLPKREKTLKLGELKGTYLGRYYQSIHYVDRAIGVFIGKLRKSGLLDRSVLFVYGDHDMGRLSGMGDVVHVMDADADASFLPRMPSGSEKVGSADSAIERLNWLRRVPLLVRMPNAEHSGERDVPGGQAQLPDTVLDLLGLPRSGRDFMSRSLFGQPDSIVAFRDGGGIQGDLLWLSGSGNDDGRCLDSRTGAVQNKDACGALSASIRNELTVSDLVIRYGLTRSGQENQ